jgi:hypothetical protein
VTELRDKLWLWGQDPGTHHSVNGANAYNLPGENTMTPVEGAEFFGLSNCCRIVMGDKPLPPFDRHSEELSAMNQVVWSILGDCGSNRNNNGGDDLDEVLRQANKYSNITGAVLDDFFDGTTGEARIPLNNLKEIKVKLQVDAPHPLDLWLVYYEIHLGRPHQPYFDLCDVITFWTWNGRNLCDLESNFEKIMQLTPGKRRLAGCYMWNYGEQKPMTIEQMKHQCSIYYDWLQKGYIEGIIICSNCITDIGLDTVEWTKNWINEIGQKEI